MPQQQQSQPPRIPPGFQIDPALSRQHGVTVVVNPQTGQRLRMAPSVGKLTEDQGKATGYAGLMADAERSYMAARELGYDPGSPGNAFASFLEGIPMLDGAGAVFRDDAGDLGRQAELQWSDAQLKAMSGAASPENEVRRNVRTFFPRPGENVEAVEEQKYGARRTAYSAARTRSGPGAATVAAYPTPEAGQGRQAQGRTPQPQGGLRAPAFGPLGSRTTPYAPRNIREWQSIPAGAYYRDTDGQIVRKGGR